MTKRAVILSVNKKVCKLILENLNETCKDIDEIKEFLEGIEELSNREYESIILNYDKEDMEIKDNEDIIKCEKLVINTNERAVYYDETFIPLTPKEYDILYLLIQNKGKVYSKGEIYSAVWKDRYSFDDNNIMAHVNKLRKKIEPALEAPIFIKTVWGVGYKFSSEIN